MLQLFRKQKVTHIYFKTRKEDEIQIYSCLYKIYSFCSLYVKFGAVENLRNVNGKCVSVSARFRQETTRSRPARNGVT